MFISSLSGGSDTDRYRLLQQLADSHCFICDARGPDLPLIQSLPSYTLRWVTSGAIDFDVAGQTRCLDNDHYLLANPEQCVMPTSGTLSECTLLLVSISRDRMRRVLRNMRASSQRIFHDDSPVSEWPVRFHQRRRTHNESVSPVLRELLDVVRLGVHDNLWLEEQYSVLAERILFDEYQRQRKDSTARRAGSLQERLVRVKRHMDEHYSEPLQLEDLASIASVSPHHFLRSFKKAFSVTPHRYLIDQRLNRARELLDTTDLSVSEIGSRIGFESANGFHSAFRRKYACSPASCRPPKRKKKPARSRSRPPVGDSGALALNANPPPPDKNTTENCAFHPGAVATGQRSLRGALQIGLDVVLDADAFDETELGFQEVDVLFLGVEDLLKQVAADEVLDGLAVGDSGAQVGHRVHLQLEIAVEYLRDVLSDTQATEVLQVGQPLQEQNSLDQAIRVLHLVNGLAVFVVGQLVDAPVLQHARMQKILVDRGQFVLQDRVQMLDDFGVAFHSEYPCCSEGVEEGAVYRRPPGQGNFADGLRVAVTRRPAQGELVRRRCPTGWGREWSGSRCRARRRR